MDATRPDTLMEMAREAAPDLLAEAFNEARAEVRSILRRRMIEALLKETERSVTSSASYERQVTVQGRSGEEMEGATVNRGVYVYGFTSAAAQPGAGLSGIDGSRTYSVVEGNLAAIVSDLSAPRHLWGMGATGEPDMAVLAPRLEEHERVLEAVLDHGTVLPMRFGTLYSSREDVRDVLRAHAPDIDAALGRLEGKVEWGLTVTWYSPAAEPDLMRAAPELIAPVQEELRTAGRAYLSRREAEKARAERRFGVSAELHRAVDSVVASSVVHPARRRRDDGGSDTLLRASYLVAKTDRGRFEDVIRKGLEAGADIGLRGELTGPWPPYNFSGLPLEGASA
jgi:hypothetical protein